MRKSIIACVIFITGTAVFAEGPVAVLAANGGNTVSSAHFEIISDSGDGETLAYEMEERFTIYNRIFRFDPAALSRPLRVRSFRNAQAYNDYVASQLGMPGPGAIYLHYKEKDRRELVINRGSPDEGKNLPYQAFTQFLRAFVSNPPAWMREGFAVFFSTLGSSGDGAVFYEENLAWLETVKNMKNPPALEAILQAGSGSLPADFQSLAWSLASFFVNSGKEQYTRALTDSFMVLSDSKSSEENAEAVMKRISFISSTEDLARDYRSYLASRKTFSEFVAEGQRAYAAGDRTGAELAFRGALEQRPGHFIPHYYLGLLAYENNNYDIAEQYYHSSIRYGADPAMVLYALGLNAASAGKNGEAIDFLRQAAAASPERYKEKAESVISRLR